MAKKIDPLKAKAAKQRKMAIGLGVMLLAVVAFQGPKTLKLLKGPPTAPVAEAGAPAPTPDTSTTASGVVPPGTPGATPVAGTTVPGGEAQPAVLVDSDVPVAAGAGQLLSFELFEAADPFEQQLDPDAIPIVPSSGSGTKSGAATGADTPKTDAGGKPGSVVPGSDSGATDGGKAPVAPQPPAAATTLSLNGEVVSLTPAAEFPVDDPIFVFVSAALDGKSIELGIAGGTYADGDETISLKLGKPLTLQNTADGSRYELELLTVQGFVTPKPKK